jgi:GINS complex subunit 4
MYVESADSTPMRGLWGPGSGGQPNDDSDLFTSSSADERVAYEAAGNAGVIYKLIHAVENTHFSPVLLPYPKEVVDRVTELIIAQTRAIEDLVQVERSENDNDPQQIQLIPFKRSDMAKFELQRVQFLLCELLRCRIRLIEKLCFLILHEENSSISGGDPSSTALSPPLARPYSELLSPNEKAIALRLAQLKHACMMSSGLRNLPEPLQQLVPALPHGEGQEILPVVESGKHVFVYMLQDIAGPIELAPDVTETMSQGEIFLVPFMSLGHLVADGRARLI